MTESKRTYGVVLYKSDGVEEIIAEDMNELQASNLCNALKHEGLDAAVTDQSTTYRKAG